MATIQFIDAVLNELRDRHLVKDSQTGLYVPTVLLEGYSANSTSASENGTGSASFASISAGAVTGPDGVASSGFSLIEDATAGVYHVLRLNAAPNATTAYDYTLGFAAKADTRTKIMVVTKTFAADGTETIINLADGTIFSAGSGKTVKIEALDNGWYWITVQWSVVGAAGTDGRAGIGLVNGSNTATYNGDGTSKCYLWRLTCYANRKVGGSPIKSTYAGGWPKSNTDYTGANDGAFGTSRPPENPLELDATAIGATPAAMTVLVTGYERGSAVQDASGGNTASGSNAVLWSIARYDGAAPYLAIARGTTGYKLVHHNGSTSVSSEAAAFPTYGQKIEHRVIFNADGSVQLGQSIDGAAEVVASASAANMPAASWATDSNAVGRVCMWVGGLGKANPQGFFALRQVVVASGSKTLAQMRVLAS